MWGNPTQTTLVERVELRANQAAKYVPHSGPADWCTRFRGQRPNLLTGTHGLGVEALAAGEGGSFEVATFSMKDLGDRHDA